MGPSRRTPEHQKVRSPNFRSLRKYQECKYQWANIHASDDKDSRPTFIIFTKVLATRQPFEKHRKTVLNLPGGSGLDAARMAAAGRALSLSLSAVACRLCTSLTLCVMGRARRK